ncbi:unnamed protein product [Mycena citricolor]|uniref:Uncharacterized protein n=1 Tax=Mycena citricolor TaxID=2018698 RepID=A0AAD2Q5A0_9AGAR|nr:unnamed protein product [Mycena citricolor]
MECDHMSPLWPPLTRLQEFVSLRIPSWDPMTQSRALLRWRPTGGPVNEGMPRQRQSTSFNLAVLSLCSSEATVPAPRHEKHSPSRLSLTALKAAHQARTVPELREEDLEETFVRGSGPVRSAIVSIMNVLNLRIESISSREDNQSTRLRIMFNCCIFPQAYGSAAMKLDLSLRTDVELGD